MNIDAQTLRNYPTLAVVGTRASALVALALVLVLASTGTKPALAGAQGPDLVVVNLALVAQGPGYQLCGAVENIGNKKAGASHLDLKIHFTGGQFVSNAFAVAALQAGATSAQSCIKGAIGTKQAPSGVGTADVNTVVAETNEGNNTSTVGDGTETVHSLLVNGIQAGQFGFPHVQNDVNHLSAALAVETRPHVITAVPGAAGAGVAPAALSGLIAATFAPAVGGPDGDDVCVFYIGMHGWLTPTAAEGGEGLDDGIFMVDPAVAAGGILDDDMDTPFNALDTDGRCGAGMVLMFMACHSGELLTGANDFGAAPPVVMTSCLDVQTSAPCAVGGHVHSCYGGNGLVRGLTKPGAAAAVARADTGGGNNVTAAELHTYAVANDGDPGADPQTNAAGSGIVVLSYPAGAPDAHAFRQADGDAQRVALGGGTGPLMVSANVNPGTAAVFHEFGGCPFGGAVGGIAELPDDGAAPLQATEPKGLNKSVLAASTAAVAVAAATVFGVLVWYLRKRRLS